MRRSAQKTNLCTHGTDILPIPIVCGWRWKTTDTYLVVNRYQLYSRMRRSAQKTNLCTHGTDILPIPIVCGWRWNTTDTYLLLNTNCYDLSIIGFLCPFVGPCL